MFIFPRRFVPRYLLVPRFTFVLYVYQGMLFDLVYAVYNLYLLYKIDS